MTRVLFPFCIAIAALAACGDPAPAASVTEPATTMAEISPAPTPVAEPPSPAPAPSGDFFETAKPGEELPTSMTTPGPIPTAFRHVWAPDRKACTADPSPTRLAIAPGAIRFYEGRSVVVTANTNLEGTVALQVDHTAEGTTTREAHILTLSPDKKQLTYDRDGQALTLIRCD